MSLSGFAWLLYLLIGGVISVYDWNKFHKKEYNDIKNAGKEVEDSMAVIYMAGVMIFWPAIILRYILYRD